MSELRFDGRSVIVTGAGRGVGRAHAMLLAARGAKVVVADLGGESRRQRFIVGACRRGREGDPSRRRRGSCVRRIGRGRSGRSFDRADRARRFGSVDVVVNNAGIAEPDWFEDLSIERFRRMVDVHYMGTVNVTFAAWPHMVKAGYGRIVNTCSEAMLGMSPKNTSYGGAKGGVFGFTRNLALDAAASVSESTRWHLARTLVSPVRRSWRTCTTFPKRCLRAVKRWRASGPSSSRRRRHFWLMSRASSTVRSLVAGAGQVMRIAVLQNEGFTKEDLTPEDVAANLDEIMDMSDAHEVGIEVLRGEIQE